MSKINLNSLNKYEKKSTLPSIIKFRHIIYFCAFTQHKLLHQHSEKQ